MVIAGKVYKKTLQLIFGFDKWHISPVGERPYAQDIIQYCNTRPVRTSFAEIGCGLGDILRNVNFAQRAGFDMDAKVLRAAGFLPVKGERKGIRYHKFVFPDSRLENSYDVLILVNWIHHVSPDILKTKLTEYFANNVNAGGVLIVDTVQDRAYKYNHNISFLTAGMNGSTEKIGTYKRQREVWAINKKK